MANTNHPGNGDLRRCSFCGRTEKEVALLIPGQKPETYICDNCIDIYLSDEPEEILADGVVTDEERPDFEQIQKELEHISMTIEAIQLWCEKMKLMVNDKKNK